VPVLRPAFQETTSLGAALAAGLAVGFWSMDEVFSHSTDAASSSFAPKVAARDANRRYQCWQKVVGLCRGLEELCDPEEQGDECDDEDEAGLPLPAGGVASSR
jgi:glycerol kinase